MRFTWGVPHGGYEWQSLHAPDEGPPCGSGRYLLPRDLAAEPAQRYDPLEDEPVLYRGFADLAGHLDEARVLAFANKHGWLGLSNTLFEIRQGRRVGLPVAAERIEDWQSEAAELLSCVDAWDASTASDRDALGTFVVTKLVNKRWRAYWTGGHLVRPRDVNPALPELSGAIEIRLIERMHPPLDHFFPFGFPNALPASTGDLRRLAMLQVAQIVSGKLLVEPTQTARRVRFDADDDRPELVDEPRSLIGAMWLQLARSIDGDRRYRRCEACNRWFEVGLRRNYSGAARDVRRRQTKTCSTGCRKEKSRRDFAQRTQRSGPSTRSAS